MEIKAKLVKDAFMPSKVSELKEKFYKLFIEGEEGEKELHLAPTMWVVVAVVT